MQSLLDDVIARNRQWTQKGKVADYIPALSTAKSDALGICVTDVNGQEWAAGDARTFFSIQSIVKAVTLLCALEDAPIRSIAKVISFEVCSDSFDSIANLETSRSHKPLNPLINSGAIAIIPFISGKAYEEKFLRVVKLIRQMTRNQSIEVNDKVYKSETLTGNRNRALAYYMKSTGTLSGDVEEVLDIYFRLCSIEVTCHDIARIGAVLAGDGLMPGTGEAVANPNSCRIVKAMMSTCGMYNESGAFATSTGIPAKSGVGGGIMAAIPGKMGIGVVGPALNSKGNSVAGIRVLSDLSSKLKLSIY